jgi:hypothetical protein
MAGENALAKTNGNGRKVTKRRVVYEPIECKVCRQVFPKLTVAHLNVHGLTIESYCATYSVSRAKFRAGRPPTGRASALDRAPLEDALVSIAHDPRGRAELAAAVSRELLAKGRLAAELAGDVERAIVAGPLRGTLTAALVQLMATRLEMHGKAAATLDALRAELSQPWRREAGGDEGGPTPTRDLVALTQTAIADLKATDDEILKVLKLAVEEARSGPAGVTSLGGALPTAAATGVPIPTDLTPAERETMRGLASMLKRGLEARRALGDLRTAVPAEAVVVSPATSSGSGPALPATTPAPAPVSASSPAETPVTRPPVENTAPSREAAAPPTSVESASDF